MAEIMDMIARALDDGASDEEAITALRAARRKTVKERKDFLYSKTQEVVHHYQKTPENTYEGSIHIRNLPISMKGFKFLISIIVMAGAGDVVLNAKNLNELKGITENGFFNKKESVRNLTLIYTGKNYGVITALDKKIANLIREINV